MIHARFTGRIVLLTAVALVLAAIALSMPWYKSTSQTANDSHITRYYYIDYVEVYITYPYSYLAGLETYNSMGLAETGVGDVMALEKNLVYAWLLVGLLFIGSVLVNSLRGCLFLGWSAVVISMLAVIQFVGRVDLGSSVTYDRSPDFGLAIATVAMVFQTGAVIARTYVLYPELQAMYEGSRPLRAN